MGLSEQGSQELSKGGHYQKLEKAVTDLETKVVQLQTQYEIKQGGIVDEEARVHSLEIDAERLRTSLGEKETEVQQLTLSHTGAKHDHDLAQQKYQNTHDLHQTLMTGLSDPNKSGGGYLGQIADAKARMAAASTEGQQSKNKLAMLEKYLTAAQARYQKVEREANDGTKQVEKGKKEIQELEIRLKKTGWSEQKEQSSADALRAARDRVRQLTQVCLLLLLYPRWSEVLQERDQHRQQISGLDFTYSDPVPNFDRRQVKGLVANLITIDESDYDKSTALEIAAGGRLYNVVVDNEQVGSQLLSKGQLRKRVTIIPLNKISAFKAAAQVCIFDSFRFRN
jgi:structural maintenance of chromosome 2